MGIASSYLCRKLQTHMSVVPPTGTYITRGPSQNMALNFRPPNFPTQYSILKYLLKPKQLLLLLTFKSQTKVICPISNPGDRGSTDSSISRAKSVGYGFSKGENTESFGLDLSLYMKMNHSIKKKKQSMKRLGMTRVTLDKAISSQKQYQKRNS